MGCWSETCGISQLPIRAGSEAVLIYLVSSPFPRKGRGRLCYAADAYIPASLPIHGTYDDYGCLEYDAAAPENAPGVLSVEILMNSAGFTGTPEEFQEKSMQGDVDYPSPHYQDVTCHVIPILILKQVWDYVVDPLNTQRDFDPYDLNKVTKDQHVNAGIGQLTALREAMQGGDPFAILTKRPSWQEPGIGSFLESSSYINLRANDIIHEWVKRSEITAESMSRAICDMTQIHTFMANNRKAWHITSGTGGQDENYTGAIAFYREMASIAEKIEQRINSEYAEFNTEEEAADEPG